MATYVNELCDMVPACSTLARKPDKLTILRLAVAHMKALQGNVAGALTMCTLSCAGHQCLFLCCPVNVRHVSDTQCQALVTSDAHNAHSVRLAGPCTCCRPSRNVETLSESSLPAACSSATSPQTSYEKKAFSIWQSDPLFLLQTLGLYFV